MKKVLSLFMCSVLAFVAFCTANVKAEDTVSLTVHYQKFDGAYEGTAFYGWNGGIGAAGLYHFYETDDFGAVKTVELAADTPIATSGAGEFIVFHSQVTEDIATDGNNPAKWDVLDNVKSTGGNIKFDGAKFAAAWATGEVHLWYYEGTVLEDGNNVAVSDGTADAKAAAAFEAVKYHEVTTTTGEGEEAVTTTTAYGYAVDGYKTVKVVMAQGTGESFYKEDGSLNWDMYSWGSAKVGNFVTQGDGNNGYPLATVMPASVAGVVGEYAIFYGYVPNDYTTGAGFIPRSYGAWTFQTDNLDNNIVPGFDEALVAVPANGALTCSVLFDQKTTDFRVGGEAVEAWLNEINAFLIDSCQFTTVNADEEGNYTTTLMFTVNKDLPVTDLTVEGVSNLANLIEVTCGETVLEVVETSFDLSGKTAKSFRVVVAGKVDTAATYNLAIEVVSDGNTYAAESVVDCDKEAPIINLLKDKEQVALCAGAGSVALPRISITDTVDGDLSKYWTIDATKNVLVDTSKAGTYTITITCQDSMGNVATKDIVFEVVDVNAGQSNANAGLALLALLPVAVVGLVATRKFAM